MQDDLQTNFSRLKEILDAVEFMDDDFFAEVDLTLLHKELARIYENIYLNPQIIEFLNNEDQKSYFKDKYEEAMLKISLLEEELKMNELNIQVETQNCSNTSVIIKNFDDNPLSSERKKRNIEDFYTDEEDEIQENLKVLENLNLKLHTINKENNEDINDLELFLQNYKTKNNNLALSNQKMLIAIEETELSEKELSEKLKEFEKILENQENDKYLYENKIKDLERNNEEYYKKITDLHNEKDQLINEQESEEKNFANLIEEKAPKKYRESLFHRIDDSIKKKNSVHSFRSFNKMLEPYQEITHNELKMTKPSLFRRKRSFTHRKQKSLMQGFVFCYSNSTNNYQKDDLNGNTKEDLYEIETKDTKDDKNNNSFLSTHEIKMRKNDVFELNQKENNNNRIMRHIKAKKLQKSLLKTTIFSENNMKQVETSKHCNNYCANCSIF